MWSDTQRKDKVEVTHAISQRNQLQSVAQQEAESSRLQLQSWLNQFAEVNAQQNLRVNSLESMLQQAEDRSCPKEPSVRASICRFGVCPDA